jgi:hypothetical protein
MLDNNLGEPKGKKSKGACFSNLGCPILCFGIHFNTWLNLLEGIESYHLFAHNQNIHSYY